jgi:hypothetical protein
MILNSKDDPTRRRKTFYKSGGGQRKGGMLKKSLDKDLRKGFSLNREILVLTNTNNLGMLYPANEDS